MVVVDLGGVSTFAAEELSSTSGVFDASVVCETLLNCAVKGSKKVGGRRRESRQQARLAARERNMMACVWNGYRYSGMSYHTPQKNIDFERLKMPSFWTFGAEAGTLPLALPAKVHLFSGLNPSPSPTHPIHDIVNRRHASE